MRKPDAQPWHRVMKMARHVTPEHVTPEDNTGVRRIYFTVLDRKVRVHVKGDRITGIEGWCAGSAKYAPVWRRIQPDGAFGLRLTRATQTYLNKEQETNGST